jgi:hypothetical protein
MYDIIQKSRRKIINDNIFLNCFIRQNCAGTLFNCKIRMVEIIFIYKNLLTSWQPWAERKRANLSIPSLQPNHIHIHPGATI